MRVIAVAGLGAAALALSGCASLAARIPDAEARSELRAQARWEQVMDQHRARQAALRQAEPGEELSFAQQLALGDQHREGGNRSKAYVWYVRAYHRDREDPRALSRIAFLAIRDEPRRAAKLFEELAEETPGEPVFHVGLGMARLALDEPAGAREALLDALALDPGSAIAWSTLGVSTDRLGHHAEAQAYLQTAHELRPADAKILNNLGVSYLLSEDWREAEGALREALDQGHDDPALRNNLGLALGLQGHYEEAFAVFREAGSEGDAYNNLGLVHYLRGDYDAALRSYEKALLSNDTDERRVVRNLALAESALEGGLAGPPEVEHVLH